MTTKTLAEVLRDEVLDSGTWEKVAEKVRAHVRYEDAARAGTLSAEQVERIRKNIAEGVFVGVASLLDHAAAQGRANAALERERDEALSIYANMLRERDEARAQLAARDARVKELEGKVKALGALSVERGAKIDAAESALATVRQAQRCEAIRERNIGLELALKEVKRSWSRAPSTSDANRLNELGDRIKAHLQQEDDATPAEHPDTATLRAIRERMSQPGRIETEAAMAGVLGAVRWVVLGDSGPSGGEETRCQHGNEGGPCKSPPLANGWCRSHQHIGAMWVTKPLPTTPPAVAASEDVDPHANYLQREANARDRCRDGHHVRQGDAAGMDGADLCMHCGTRVPTPSPTPEEDWARLERWVAYGLDPKNERHAALARLRDEPRRAAEAMRERHLRAIEAERKRWGAEVNATAGQFTIGMVLNGVEARIRALEVKP